MLWPRAIRGTAWALWQPAARARGTNSGHRSRAASRSMAWTWMPWLKASMQGPCRIWACHFLTGETDPGEQAANDALDSSLARLEEQVRLRVDGGAG